MVQKGRRSQLPGNPESHDHSHEGGHSREGGAAARQAGFASGFARRLAPTRAAAGDAGRRGLASRAGTGLSDDELIGLLRAARRLGPHGPQPWNWRWSLISPGRRRASPDRDGPDPGEHVDAEVAAALTLTPGAAARLHDLALSLTRLPSVQKALGAGRIDQAKAATIVAETSALDDTAAAGRGHGDYPGRCHEHDGPTAGGIAPARDLPGPGRPRCGARRPPRNTPGWSSGARTPAPVRSAAVTCPGSGPGRRQARDRRRRVPQNPGSRGHTEPVAGPGLPGVAVRPARRVPAARRRPWPEHQPGRRQPAEHRPARRTAAQHRPAERQPSTTPPSGTPASTAPASPAKDGGVPACWAVTIRVPASSVALSRPLTVQGAGRGRGGRR